MSGIIKLPNNQPQVTVLAKEKLASEFIDKGIVALALDTHWELLDTEKMFGNYLLHMGESMTKIQPEIPWHSNLLRVGAGVAYGAYRESGYKLKLSEDFVYNELMAEINGVPESYICSLEDDQNLLSLIDESLSDHKNILLQQPQYKYVLGIGAGCVRYYQEQSMKVA